MWSTQGCVCVALLEQTITQLVCTFSIPFFRKNPLVILPQCCDPVPGLQVQKRQLCEKSHGVWLYSAVQDTSLLQLYTWDLGNYHSASISPYKKCDKALGILFSYGNTILRASRVSLLFLFLHSRWTLLSTACSLSWVSPHQPLIRTLHLPLGPSLPQSTWPWTCWERYWPFVCLGAWQWPQSAHWTGTLRSMGSSFLYPVSNACPFFPRRWIRRKNLSLRLQGWICKREPKPSSKFLVTWCSCQAALWAPQIRTEV